jgi:hypothetical protein
VPRRPGESSDLKSPELMDSRIDLFSSIKICKGKTNWCYDRSRTMATSLVDSGFSFLTPARMMVKTRRRRGVKYPQAPKFVLLDISNLQLNISIYEVPRNPTPKHFCCGSIPATQNIPPNLNLDTLENNSLYLRWRPSFHVLAPGGVSDEVS